jgi:hypothetical protein
MGGIRENGEGDGDVVGGVYAVKKQLSSYQCPNALEHSTEITCTISENLKDQVQ